MALFLPTILLILILQMASIGNGSFSASNSTGVPNKASVPQILADAFKNLLAVAVATEYTFPQAKHIKEVLKNPGAFAAAPAAAPASAAAKAPQSEPEEEEAGAFSLFD